MLSKDHFGLILNEPAGKIAQVVVIQSVNLLVKAFEDEGCDIDRVVDEVSVIKVKGLCTLPKRSFADPRSLPPSVLCFRRLPNPAEDVR